MSSDSNGGDVPSTPIIPVSPRQPWRCPVCHGKGIVPNGFYSSTEQTWGSTSTTPEKCRSCAGTGVLYA